MRESPRQVGRVAALWRYPVKSMAAEALQEADVSSRGLAGDRRWAFVRDAVAQSSFPWLTMRERADLCHYRPFFVEPARPDQSSVVVRTPSGGTFDVADSALAAELYPRGARAIRQDDGVFDTFPLSLISTQAISQIGGAVGARLDPLRFRPNILLDVPGEGSFPEDGWVGRVLRIGGLRLRIDKRDGRCIVITIDPVTTERNPAILRTVTSDRDGCLGVYGSTLAPGRVAVGDPVVIESSGPPRARS